MSTRSNVVLIRQRPTECCLYTKKLKVIPTDELAQKRLDGVATIDLADGCFDCGDPRKSVSCSISQIFEIRVGKRLVGIAWRVLIDSYELLRLFEWRFSQNHSVDETENRDIGPDSQRERGHGRHGKTRTLHQAARGIMDAPKHPENECISTAGGGLRSCRPPLVPRDQRRRGALVAKGSQHFFRGLADRQTVLEVGDQLSRDVELRVSAQTTLLENRQDAILQVKGKFRLGDELESFAVLVVCIHANLTFPSSSSLIARDLSSP